LPAFSPIDLSSAEGGSPNFHAPFMQLPKIATIQNKCIIVGRVCNFPREKAAARAALKKILTIF